MKRCAVWKSRPFLLVFFFMTFFFFWGREIPSCNRNRIWGTWSRVKDGPRWRSWNSRFRTWPAAHLSSCQRGDVTKVCDAAQLGGHGHQSSLPASLGTLGQAETDHHGLLVILPAEQNCKVTSEGDSHVNPKLRGLACAAPHGCPVPSGSLSSPGSPPERRCTAASAPGSRSFWGQLAADAPPEPSSCPHPSCLHLNEQQLLFWGILL